MNSWVSMGKSTQQTCRQHKNYKSSQKIDGKIAFRCKKNVPRSSSKIISKENSFELSSVSDTTKTSSKKIYSSQLSHEDLDNSRLISRTEIQLKPCSVVLKKIKFSREPKHKENILEAKEVPQFHSANKASVFKHRTLDCQSSRVLRSQSSPAKIKSLEISIPIKKYLSTQKRRTSSELNTKSRRNCVLHQPKTPTQNTSVKKEILSKHSRKFSSSSERLNQFQGSTKSIPIDDLSFSRTPSLLSLAQSDEYKNIPIKQISKHRRKSEALFQNQSVIAASDNTSQRQKHTLVKNQHQKSEEKSKRTRSSTHIKPIDKKTRSGRKPKKQIVPIQTQSQKTISSKHSENVPIDDLALKKRKEKSKTFRFKQNIVKHKRNAIDALKTTVEQYEDDLYEHKNFDKFKELFVDTSPSPVPSGMSTPKWECLVTPKMSQISPNFVDCISLSDYKLYRNVAVECMKRENVDISVVSVSSF